MRFTLIGSYNGQDSLGDECLLKVVMDHITYHNSDAEFDIHIHDQSGAFTEDLKRLPNLRVVAGIQTLFSQWHGLFGRARLPHVLSLPLAVLTFPLALLGALLFNIRGARTTFTSLTRTQAVYFYGGTIFSWQWFWLNAPHYFLSMIFARLSGAEVYMCPQQYGPLTATQSTLMKLAFRWLVTDWRTRNPLDPPLLAPNDKNPARVVFDDVYSNRRLYPTLCPAPEKKHILVNLRATTFSDDSIIQEDSFRAFAKLIRAVHEELQLPIVYFGVSAGVFSEDDLPFDLIAEAFGDPSQARNAGRVKDEYEIFDLAQTAAVTISMSFHGCLLSGIGGAPFVAVTEGRYYDFKYEDFDKYTGHQGSPLIALSTLDPDRDAARISAFVKGWQHEVFAAQRDQAFQLATQFYHDAASA